MIKIKKEKIYFLEKGYWSEEIYKRIVYYKNKKINKKNISVMLTGGNTAKELYSSWHSKKMFFKNNIKLFLTDERCTKPISEKSNYYLIKKYLLDTKVIKSTEVCRIEAESENKDLAMKKYLSLLPASIDILFLSLASDGHIASIFPNSNLMTEDKKLINITDRKQGGFYRISISPLVIKRARLVFIFVKGKERGKLLANNAKKNENLMPFNLINNGVWFLDKEASKAYKKQI